MSLPSHSGTEKVVRHRRCMVVGAGGYNSSSSYVPPRCVMCGQPVTPDQAQASWPVDPCRSWVRLHRHPQAASNGVPYYRFDRKWGRSR